MVRKLIAAILVAVASLGSATAFGQDYRFELGPALGLSGYLGDANKGNLLRHPSYVAGGVFRYLINNRWAVKANLLTANIKGEYTPLMSEIEEKIKMSSQIYDIGAQAEFNFFNFGIGSKYLKLKRITPYMVLGLGISVGCPKDGKTAFTLNLPMGVGVKYKLRERLNIGLEFTMRKAFGDGLDGIVDPESIKHGFAKNTDWYSFLMFTLTYEFSKRCKICHYVE